MTCTEKVNSTWDNLIDEVAYLANNELMNTRVCCTSWSKVIKKYRALKTYEKYESDTTDVGRSKRECICKYLNLR